MSGENWYINTPVSLILGLGDPWVWVLHWIPEFIHRINLQLPLVLSGLIIYHYWLLLLHGLTSHSSVHVSFPYNLNEVPRSRAWDSRVQMTWFVAMMVELSGKRRKGYRIRLGKELSKAVALAAEWLRPDPWGSSRIQIIPQSWSSLESRGSSLWIAISVRYFLRIALKDGGGLIHPPNVGSDLSFKDNAPEKGPLKTFSSQHLKLVDGCIGQWRKSWWAQNIQCTSVETGVLILVSGLIWGYGMKNRFI